METNDKGSKKWNFDLSRKINAFGWGLFLVFSGVFWLLSDPFYYSEYFFVGTALILLGTRLFKYFRKIRSSEVPTAIGLILLIYGLAGLTGNDSSLMGAILTVIGVFVLVSSFSKKKREEQGR